VLILDLALTGVGAIPSFLSLIGLIIERYLKQSVVEDHLHLTPINTAPSKLDDNYHDINSDIDSPVDGGDKSHALSLFNNKIYQSYMIASGGTWLLFDIVAFGVSLSGR
jgi:hypothetical protein